MKMITIAAAMALAATPAFAATQIRDLLERRRIPHEVKIYPDQGHGFTGAAAHDAAVRIAGFFGRYLAG